MAWNPYTDQQNRGYAHILTTLFPEQTKTLPRILIWSLIFLMDLTAGISLVLPQNVAYLIIYTILIAMAAISIALILDIRHRWNKEVSYDPEK